MSATQPGFARIWAWREEMGDVYTGEWAPEGDTHVPVEAKEYTLSEGVEPTEPGGFPGDIFYGDPIKTTMGTHRWENGQWVKLPSELEATLGLLADAREERDDALTRLAAAKAANAALEARLENGMKWCDLMDGPVSKSQFVNGQATAAQQIRAALAAVQADARREGGE